MGQIYNVAVHGWSLFQLKRGAAMAIERLENLSDEVTEGRSS